MKRLTVVLVHFEIQFNTILKRKLNAFSNSIVLSLSILILAVVFSSTALAQQKSSVVQQAEEQLVVVNTKIAEIDARMNAINNRIAGISPENVDPSVLVRLNDLQLTKDQYTREKISIEAVLDNDQDELMEFNN